MELTDVERFVERLAAARIGRTYNFYRQGERAELLRGRLADYLIRHADAPVLLVGEAPGYRGARISGLPFTSERQLTGSGPAEATATIVQRTLAELELDALCWNVVPTHPGTAISNRTPMQSEVVASAPFLAELARTRRVIAVGRVAEAATGAPYVRHPSHGGASEFHVALLRVIRSARSAGKPGERGNVHEEPARSRAGRHRGSRAGRSGCSAPSGPRE